MLKITSPTLQRREQDKEESKRIKITSPTLQRRE